MEKIEHVKNLLIKIYGEKKGSLAFKMILPLIEKNQIKKNQQEAYFSEKDIYLITYGDTLNKKGEAPLNTLLNFSKEYFKDVFSDIHILPFCPFSSDDGFSVIDFCAVNPELGTWEDIKAFSSDFKLMFDLVLNHISAQSEWFKKYLEKEEGFEDLAIEQNLETDLSLVTRPRSLPLLTEFTKKTGEKVNVWTTFSSDQIDLNYKSIDVLEKMLKALFYYVKHGAKCIRLDAIAYLWKEIGTNCVHLTQTHDMVKLFRALLDVVAPDVILITETNVPHNENISYFGNGSDEAQMVYNFTLPPLLLYTLMKGDASILSNWAKGLNCDSGSNTFFNFLSSHDGIGVRPLEGILSNDEIDYILERVKENGGRVSYKKNPDGSESPYELNITYLDALLNKKEKDGYDIRPFLAAHSIQYVLPGVPATYIHSILGSENWQEGVSMTKRARSINREKLQVDEVSKDLQKKDSMRSRIFSPLIELIKVRKKQIAFHPNSDFEILDMRSSVFAVARYGKGQNVYALTNVSPEKIKVPLNGSDIPANMVDLLTGATYSTEDLSLHPYQYLWLSEKC